tara:strand:- start:643 stop:1683 length:1041 start_codon:yes stop_codon:yes gene_type:complete
VISGKSSPRWTLAAALAALSIVSSVSAQTDSSAEEALSTEAEPPEAYVERALDILQQYHMNRQEIDWEAMRQAVRVLSAKAKTPGDTHAALRAAVAAMGDNHGHLYIPQPRRQASASSAGEKETARAMPAMPEGKPIDGNIGYLMLPPLMTVGGNEDVGTQYRERLVGILQGLDASARCGWVVDLRQNAGGNMWPMLNGLDPLLGPGPFGYFVGAEGRVAWVRGEDEISSGTGSEVDTGEPQYALANADAPVAILFGPRTASTGEMVAIALTGRENSRSFGAKSANYTTAVRPFTLSDGAILGVTSSKVAYRDGATIEGPLVPDVAVDADALEPALEWLHRECAAN